MAYDFEGKVALVTGATSGIGRATVLALADAGCALALTGRDRRRGEELAELVTAKGGQALFLSADLRRPEAVANILDATLGRFGRLDITFNNAGCHEPRAPLTEQRPEEYDRVFDLNLRAVLLAMQGQIAVMRGAGEGVIINNASVSGVRNPNPGFALYSASKAALLSLTRSAAMECAPLGIRINAVSPGRVETPLLRATGVDLASVAAGLPARRLGLPEEVAAAVLWLASPSARFVIGHNLCIDGGFLAA
jgi:NAD(P)-dependent dehydrogenase (short-subunit alcohol dehydrogenase family)